MKSMRDYRNSQFYDPVYDSPHSVSRLTDFERAIVRAAEDAWGKSAEYVTFFVVAPRGEIVGGVGVALFSPTKGGYWDSEQFFVSARDTGSHALVSWHEFRYSTRVFIAWLAGRTAQIRAEKVWFGRVKEPAFTYAEDPDEW
ncbi:MAG: hypothetical protein D6694_12270 [Gammaproteobacteria bacterium]|nr:MAG: hypothetical protein D6694_12270 [Gammaproteobacteria bacterium]